MKRIRYILFLIVIVFGINNNYVYCDELKDIYKHDFNITAKEAILYNLNDDYVLYEKDINKRVPIASLTKIMTSIVAIENIDNLDEKVVITNEYFYGLDGYALAGFQVGNTITYRDLLYGVMLPSGAEAVNAIILNVADSKSKFIDLMNEKAKELNLTNTHFDNAIGIDSDDNYSTAYDLGVLLKYALKNDSFKEIFTTRKYIVKSNNLILASTLEKYSKNSNLDISNIGGAKSGFTDAAGLCLASIFSYNDIDYLLVVLGSDTSNRKNAIMDSLTIYNYYKDNFSYKKIVTKDIVIKKIPVKLANIKEYNITCDKDMVLYLPNDVSTNDVIYKYDGIDEITHKNKDNSKLGNIKVLYNDIELASFDTYMDKKITFYYPYICSIVVIIIAILIIKLLKPKKKRKKKKRSNKKHK